MAVVATYCFVSPFSTKETVDLLNRVFLRIGKVKKMDNVRGYVLCKYQINFMNYVKMEFFVERSEENCKVRATYHNYASDEWWDGFLTALFEESPGTDFGVSLANDNAYIAGVLYLGDETQQIHTSRTIGGTSILGFLAGGALFGAPGAIVGGMSGKQRTVGSSFTQFADNQLVRVIYNNGKLWEGTVKKGSKLYNEIMVNI